MKIIPGNHFQFLLAFGSNGPRLRALIAFGFEELYSFILTDSQRVSVCLVTEKTPISRASMSSTTNTFFPKMNND